MPRPPATEAAGPPTASRSRGSRAGLTVTSILDAAEQLNPGEITMQAVADRLGVDRKAVNHHVHDRDTLLALLAFRSFSRRLATVRIRRGSWQEACRSYARGIVHSVEALGPLADHLQLRDPALTSALRPAERVAAALADAGLDDQRVQRTLAMLTNISLSFVRDVMLAGEQGSRPRVVNLRSALAAVDPTRFAHMAEIAAHPVNTYGRAQLEFGLDVFVGGVERLLEQPA